MVFIAFGEAPYPKICRQPDNISYEKYCVI